MGYYSEIDGTITLSHPLRQPVEPANEADQRDERHDGYSLTLATRSRAVDVDVEGVTHAVALVEFVAIEAPEESGKFRDFKSSLEEAVDYCLSIDPSVSFSGHMQRDGEENSDMERYYVNERGEVVTVKAIVSWPAPDLA